MAVKKSRRFSSLVIYLYKGVHYLSKTVHKRVRGWISVRILRSWYKTWLSTPRDIEGLNRGPARVNSDKRHCPKSSDSA